MNRTLEEYHLKHKFITSLTLGLLCTFLTGCGEDPELTHFRNNMDGFCEKIAEIDTAINHIDASSENAPEELLDYLDELDLIFQSLGRMDFPEEFDYLEPIADEAGSYMTEAVKSYHEAFANDSYNEFSADYAGQNYSRAYKRVKIILDFLQGETPEDAEISIEYSE